MPSQECLANLSHRTGAYLGGIFLVMGGGVSTGGFYEWVFHRNLALEVNGNYNYGVLAMGPGPRSSGGMDVSLNAMLYNFGKANFSKGFGLSLGGGTHYLIDFNLTGMGGKRTFLVFPLSMEIFYYHLFDNNWFLKTGLKAYLAQTGNQLTGPKMNISNAPKILPLVYFALGYAF